MGDLPNLSSSFRARYDISNSGQIIPPDNNPPQDWILGRQALVPVDQVTIHAISNVAKLDELGVPIRKWMYQLPPMAIVGILQQVWHIKGASVRQNMPFKLKALGRIDSTQVLMRKGTLVSDEYVVVP